MLDALSLIQATVEGPQTFKQRFSELVRDLKSMPGFTATTKPANQDFEVHVQHEHVGSKYLVAVVRFTESKGFGQQVYLSVRNNLVTPAGRHHSGAAVPKRLQADEISNTGIQKWVAKQLGSQVQATVEPAHRLTPEDCVAAAHKAAASAGWKVTDDWDDEITVYHDLVANDDFDIDIHVRKESSGLVSLEIKLSNDNDRDCTIWYNYDRPLGGSHGAKGLSAFLVSTRFTDFLRRLARVAEASRPSFVGADLENHEAIEEFCKHTLPH